jgi:hypothetical protein
VGRVMCFTNGALNIIPVWPTPDSNELSLPF